VEVGWAVVCAAYDGCYVAAGYAVDCVAYYVAAGEAVVYDTYEGCYEAADGYAYYG